MGYGKIVYGNVVIDDVTLVIGLEVNLLSVIQFVGRDLDSANKDGISSFYTKASEEQSRLWHKKLSHLNFKAINTLVKKDTNSRGEIEDGSITHTNDEENDEDTSQQTHTRKWDRSHTREAIIADPTTSVRTRSATATECLHAWFLSHVEPKKTEEALMDPNWISVMQEELNQFKRNKV
ncbi:hypothetical protein AgCh_000658 [Apium graveolens]